MSSSSSSSSLTQLSSTQDLNSFRNSHSNSLICYSATWCGPCRQSKPQLEALATQLSSSHQCDFAIVYEEHLGEDLHKEGVRAFPTYVLYLEHGRVEGGRVQGVNLAGVEELVKGKCGARDPFMTIVGAGQSLGGAPVGNSFNIPAAPLSADEARKLRLARFAGQDQASDNTTMEVEPTSKDKDMVTEMPSEIVEEKDDHKMQVEESNENDEVKMIDPTLKLDSALVDQLTDSMGFSRIRAQKGLLNSSGTVEGAVEWLLAHQDDEDIDNPIEKVPENPATAKSYKCNECGKILSNMANLELHANKTGHSDFEESTQEVKTLTAEEKAQKVQEIKALLAVKRAEREEIEKVDNIKQEKQRRFMGKEMLKTKEEMDRDLRKREAYLRKKEKEDARKERERIRAELAKDKAERVANKGKLQSRLGVDGYNPSAIQYEVGPDGKSLELNRPMKEAKIDNKSAGAKVDDCIKKVSAYRAGGDGGKCLKILLAYVKNVSEQDDDKFKTINMHNKAYIGRVKPFIGAKALLLAVGFAPTESKDALVLSPDIDKELLKETKLKLETALASY